MRAVQTSGTLRTVGAVVRWHRETLRSEGRHALAVRLVAVPGSGRPRVLQSAHPARSDLRAGRGKVVLNLTDRQGRVAAQAHELWLTATQRFDSSGDADSLFESAYVTTRKVRTGAKARRAWAASGAARNCSRTAVGAAVALDRCRLVGAHLGKVDLSHASAQHTDLRAVRLRGANVTGTSLAGASLEGTGLGTAVENPTGTLRVASGAVVPEGTRVVVFQRDLGAALPVVWQVLPAAQPGGAATLAIPGSLYLRIVDDFGNFSPALAVQIGQEWSVGRSPLGLQPSLAGAAAAAGVIQVDSSLPLDVTVQLLRGGAVVAQQTLGPGSTRVTFQPSSSYTAAVWDSAEQGDPMDAAILEALASGQQEFAVRPGRTVSLELVMPPGGAGPVLQ